MTGREYVLQIKKIDTILKNKAFEIKRLKELGLACGATFDDMTRLEIERAQIIKVIEQLPEAEYDVLHKVYVQGETLQEIASDRDESYSLITKIHGWGLKRLEGIVNK